MLEGKELILATKKYAKEDRKKSWILTISTLAVLALTYVGIFFNVHIIGKIICSVLAGLTLVRMFIIYHDYIHKSILQKSQLANAIFTVFGLYILAPKSIWKRSHDYHHQHNSKLYTSGVGSFPIVTKEKFVSSSWKERTIYLFIRHPLTVSFGYLFAFIYGMCIRSFASSPRKHWDSLVSLFLHFGVGTMMYLFAGWEGVILGFVMPALISSALGTYFFYAQHNFPGVTYANKDGWTYISAALSSSSYMKMNRLMRWFSGNIGYHHIHHLNARIPFYNLPKVFAEIPELQQAKRTSLNPRDIFRCFKLKVWDEEAQRMIGRKELFRYKSAVA